jgi:hypothetical protein
MPGEEMLMSMVGQGIGGGGKKKGSNSFLGSGEFFSGLADQAIEKGFDLYKFLAEERRKKHDSQVAESQANRGLDIEAQQMRNSAASADRTGGMNALAYLSGQRQAAVPGSRTRIRDSLIYGA